LRLCRCDTRRGENVDKLSGAYDGIDLGDILANLIAEAFNQASGYD
jgi:hypothetical protein